MHSNLKSEKTSYNELTKMAEGKIKARIESEYQKMENDIGSPYTSVISKVLTSVGRPVEEILTSADKEKYDIIVMGTHGNGFLKDSALGSVADAVSQESKKPVIVVPLPALQKSA